MPEVAPSRRAAGRSPDPSQPSPVVEDGLAMAADLLVRRVAEARARDDLERGQDAPHEIGPARPQILVGGVDERLDGHPGGIVAGHVALEALLEGVARVLAA